MRTHTPQKRAWKEATERPMTRDEGEPKNTDNLTVIASIAAVRHTHMLHVTRLAKRPPRHTHTPGFIPKIDSVYIRCLHL